MSGDIERHDEWVTPDIPATGIDVLTSFKAEQYAARANRVMSEKDSRIAELEAQVKVLEAEIRRLRAMFVDLETH